TPPRGGRLGAAFIKSIDYATFQLTPPRGGRRPRPARSSGRLRTFQLTPPRGGRREGGPCYPSRRSFNSRPRAGGDQYAHPLHAVPPVSTHAPARGAT